MNALEIMRLTLLPFAGTEIAALSNAETVEIDANGEFNEALAASDGARERCIEIRSDVAPYNGTARWTQADSLDGERAQLTYALAYGRMDRARRTADDASEARAKAFDALRNRALRGE